MTESDSLLVGDLITISPQPPVVSLSDLERIKEGVSSGVFPEAFDSLLRHYSLTEQETRAAFEQVMDSLADGKGLGAALHIQGIYGSGKSHLLAAVSLLVSLSEKAWPPFLETHPEYGRYREAIRDRYLVASIALDEYPTRTHSLEYIVFSRIERELSRRHGAKAALTEQSYLLELIKRYVRPQWADELDEYARHAAGREWEELEAEVEEEAAKVALAFLEEKDFPLDWRRSRTEAWVELQGALELAGREGLVILLDELGLFLAGKSRSELNNDASFLQWLVQRTATSKCLVMCATQRGLTEVGDIDRRTVRQLRDRFRAGFTLGLAELARVVEHTIAPRREPDSFKIAMRELAQSLNGQAGEECLNEFELAATYPINPACLEIIRYASEANFSRTRSVVKILQEATREMAWLSRPAGRLITPEVVFDMLRAEMALSEAGRKHLHAYEVVMANGSRIAKGREEELAVVIKALCLLGLAEMRMTEPELRAALVGCEPAVLWREPERLGKILRMLYQRGVYVERSSGREKEQESYYLEVGSDITERIRGRLNELINELDITDARVFRSVLETCRESNFPLASFAEPRTITVQWLNTKRFIKAYCTDIRAVTATQLAEFATALEAPQSREEVQLLFAAPTFNLAEQREAWLTSVSELPERLRRRLLAWFPVPLDELGREQLIEHTALSSMIFDRTLARRGSEMRDSIRARWNASEEDTRRLVKGAFYEGNILTAEGHEALERERLWSLFGDWEEILAQALATQFEALAPRFHEIAPSNLLTSRHPINQIISEFIWPGRAMTPEGSSLAGHILAYAEPMGLVEWVGKESRVALRNQELTALALNAFPESGPGAEQQDEPRQLGELIGRLAKSEWGLSREQGELFIAALLRTGLLVGLDAFLQPMPLEQIAPPLGDNLPFVTRGRPLAEEAAKDVLALWEAASGQVGSDWGLAKQEHIWGFFLTWSQGIIETAAAHAELITRASLSLGHQPEDWDWARQALGRAEASARLIDRTRTSREGLTGLVQAVEQLPGGLLETCEMLAEWRCCVDFMTAEADELKEMRSLLSQAHTPEEESLLYRQREEALKALADARQVALLPSEARALASGWLDSYRRHYLAWHTQVHSAGRFAELINVRRSACCEAARRLARAGILRNEANELDQGLAKAIGRRCLAGNPLPAGRVTCPICGVKFKEVLQVVSSEEIGGQAELLVKRQLAMLSEQEAMLERRLEAVAEERLWASVARLLTFDEASHEELLSCLTEEVVDWISRHLSEPRARRRKLRDLEAKLRGKELAIADVLRIVREWLGEEEGYVEFD